MILGIGTDLIEIDRIKRAIEKNNKFIEKIFTEQEIEYFKKRLMNIEVIAGTFAAKEAVSKALGTGIRGFSFRDIEIKRNELGKPIIILHKKAHSIVEDLIGEYGRYRMHLSISHGKEIAIAYVILEGDIIENR